MSVAGLYRNRGVNPLAVQGGSMRLANDANTAGLWLFTEGAGTLTYDTKTPTKYGTLTAAGMWTTEGPWLGGLSFDGSAQGVDANLNWFPYSSAWSIELVGYFPLGNANTYILTAFNRPAVIHGYVANTVEVYVDDYSGDNPRTGSQIAIATAGWYYIVYCYSAGSWRGYKNGTEVFNLNKTFSFVTQGAPFSFGYGGSPYNAWWTGKLAIVRISNSARSAAEILTNAKLMGFA